MTVKSYFVSFFFVFVLGVCFFLVRGGSYIYIDLLTVLNSINRARRETSASSVMWRCARTLTLLLYGLYLFFLLQKKSSPVAFFFFWQEAWDRRKRWSQVTFQLDLWPKCRDVMSSWLTVRARCCRVYTSSSSLSCVCPDPDTNHMLIPGGSGSIIWFKLNIFFLSCLQSVGLVNKSFKSRIS